MQTIRKEYASHIELARELIETDGIDFDSALGAAHCVLEWDPDKGVWFYLCVPVEAESLIELE